MFIKIVLSLDYQIWIGQIRQIESGEYVQYKIYNKKRKIKSFSLVAPDCQPEFNNISCSGPLIKAHQFTIYNVHCVSKKSNRNKQTKCKQVKQTLCSLYAVGAASMVYLRSVLIG